MGNTRTISALKRIIQKFSPELVFLSETKVKGVIAKSAKKRLGFENGFSVDCSGKSGGLILLWNSDCKVSLLSHSKGHIDVRVERDGEPTWRFSGFYGCLNQINKRDSWELLRRLRSVDDFSWLCGGDFNEILRVKEKSGGSNKSILGICQFREVIDDCNLVDLGFEGPKMTWNNRRDGDNNVQERIDRMLADTAWIDLFPGARVQHLGYNSSDHRPLLLSFADGFQGARKTNRKPFKFEHFWLKEEECSKVIREAWNLLEVPHSLGDLERKLMFCAGKLSFWSLAKFGSLRKRIEEKQKEVEELLSRAQIKGTMSLTQRPWMLRYLLLVVPKYPKEGVGVDCYADLGDVVQQKFN
ncbi:hypothetical protein EZV62_018377 [Acer yangbiense]|uniref:Endonuclease/exonuclease/phosphatase domain-containing protein n=1 Tax=Acer yangbiense TaxID=1000413 RepID=A0A5C7HJN1_9ROSI|nr:hypothetical protein EZV62_018377 [Acer yangbiense]